MSMKTETYLGSAGIGVVLILVLVGVVYSLTAGRFQAAATGAVSSEAVLERIKPIGRVTVATGEAEAPAAQVAAAAPAADASPGEKTYDQVCFVCHGAGVAGAPKLGDKDAWAPRIAQGKDVLLATAINGKGAMPPRGTCAACSDDDLKAAIEFMLSKVE